MKRPTIGQLREMINLLPDETPIDTQWQDITENPEIDDYFQIADDDKGVTHLVIMTVL